VVEDPGRPGAYSAIAFLRPHFQLDEMAVTLRLLVPLPVPQTEPASPARCEVGIRQKLDARRPHEDHDVMDYRLVPWPDLHALHPFVFGKAGGHYEMSVIDGS